METFSLSEVATSLSYTKIIILIVVAFFASVISGISGYGGGMTLGLLVSPFIPVKLLVPLMSIFVLFMLKFQSKFCIFVWVLDWHSSWFCDGY